jgi:IS5 family transposase
MKIFKEKAMTFFDYDLDAIVEAEHPLRRISTLVSFGSLTYRFKDLESTTGRSGYGLEVGLKSLFLQFYYDLSDRQLEEHLRYNIAAKWFLGFKVDDRTPDHSFFGRIRETLGTKRIHELLRVLNDKAKEKGVMKSLFSFVDASAIRSKETTWKERDKAMAKGEEDLNNENIEKYSSDPDARFGCKGKDKFWYGYKRHASVEMGSGLIECVAVTPANVTDQDGLRFVCPKERVVFGDKAYCLKPAQLTMKANGCASAAILKNNMRGKNKDLDRWRCRLRMPFESTFSQLNKKARYRGLAKIQMQAVMEAIAFNVKRLLVIHSPPLFAGA